MRWALKQRTQKDFPEIEHTETIIVQITNQKAYKLLQDLEELQLIKLVKLSREPKQRLSEKYASKKLPADLVHALQNDINQTLRELNTRSI